MTKYKPEIIDDRELAWWHYLTSKMNTLYHQKMLDKCEDKEFRQDMIKRYNSHTEKFKEMYDKELYDGLEKELKEYCKTVIIENNQEPDVDEEELTKAQSDVEKELGL